MTQLRVILDASAKTTTEVSLNDQPSRNLQEGDSVLKKGEQLLPTRCPLARIVEVNRGKDGYVLVATVRKSEGNHKRPIGKIVLLIRITQNSQDRNNADL